VFDNKSESLHAAIKLHYLLMHKINLGRW